MSARKTWMLLAIGAAAMLGAAVMPGSASWIGQLLFASPAPPSEASRPAGPAWVASAPGKVEPVSGEVRIDSLALGRVADVMVKVNDRVGEGDLLVRLDDEEARARLSSTEAQVALRKYERDCVPAKGTAADLRKAEDAVAAAERALAAARRAGDRRSAGGAASPAPGDAREAVAAAQRRLEAAREELARRKQVPVKAPDARDTALTVARAELSAAEALFEKTRVRAPFAGTVLQLPVRVGEIVGPGRERPLVVLADLSRLRVRAELDERHRARVSIGHPALVRAEGFAEPFTGTVAAIAPALVPATSGGGRRPQQGSVVEVLVDLADPSQLMPGMQVDVFFLKSDAGQPGRSLSSG
jgi:HlyD family secretion protein